MPILTLPCPLVETCGQTHSFQCKEMNHGDVLGIYVTVKCVDNSYAAFVTVTVADTKLYQLSIDGLVEINKLLANSLT